MGGVISVLRIFSKRYTNERKMVMVDIPREFGHTVIIACSTFGVASWMMIMVAKARHKFNFMPPGLYHPTNKDFNCVQRVHQNTLEMIPQFLTTLFLAALWSPTTANIAGYTWVVSRVIYALGYYTGNPNAPSVSASACFSRPSFSDY